MLTYILKKIFGTKNDREVKRIRAIVEKINRLEPSFLSLSDSEISEKTAEFKARVARGESLDALLPEAFALVREASKRALNMRHYDVQMIGGIVLHRGKIAEMKTGEGKTLVATLALYLNSLTGKGAQLITVNDYLARRDAEWMMPLYNLLGVSVGIIQNSLGEEERKAAYAADITYGTNSEFGFDYLRDNMKFDLEQYVQRDLAYCIVDEVDSILIDEAQTPLIISGAAEKSSSLYADADRAVQRLNKNGDYEVDEKARSVHLTEIGTDKIEHALGVDNLYSAENTLLHHHVNQALKAHVIFKRDVDYVVHDNEVLIVDDFTGRILAGRRYSDGLHQALEAKEGVTIERENQTLATITLQNFFRMYKKCAGMTGTAQTEAEEFHKIYKLEVVTIPTNRPVLRIDEPDAVFLNRRGKFKAILADIIACYERRQPVLVGTISVETSELIGVLLQQAGVPHNILNAKQHAREAEIVAHAGRAGAVTIATNMAGRGTDIKLTEEARAAGGLRIIGTERHESRRIDNQLRGRSGRQGDVGSSKFYLSLEDDLIRIFAGDTLKQRMERAGMEENEPVESSFLSKMIENAQEKVEKRNFDRRKSLIEYDDVMNQQRKVVYAFRREILEGSDQTFKIITDVIHDVVEDAVMKMHQAPEGPELASDFIDPVTRLAGICRLHPDEITAITRRFSKIEDQYDALVKLVIAKYSALREQLPAEIITEGEKWTLLEAVDHHWKIHLQVTDTLKEGIGLRGYGQKNPILEYKKEAFDAFTEMMLSVKIESLSHLFRIDPKLFSQEKIAELEQERREELEAIETISSDDSISGAGQAEPVRSDKVGRNDMCTCGSGKKYKHCCGARK